MWSILLASALAEPVGELWVRGASREELAERGAAFAEGRDGEWVLAHGRADALDALERDFETRDRRADHRLGARDDRLSVLEAELEALGAVQVGTSVEGRPILAIQRGEGPRVRVLAGHHGDETVAVELAMELARSLEVPGRSLLIVPVLNPDGFAEGSRQNANEVDLNRNHDLQWQSSVFSGDHPFSEPEVRAVRALAAHHPPAIALSLHSGAENIGYPWNHSRDPAPEEAELELLGAVYAARVEDLELLNGADWYVTYGDSNDWTLGRQGGWEYTVELSVEKAPADPAPVVEAHLPAVEAFAAAELHEGVVLDAETGRPLAARLSAEGVSPFWSSPLDGSWAHRLPGPFLVEAVGYAAGDSDLGQLSPTERLDVETRLVPVLGGRVALDLEAEEAWLARPHHEDVLLEERGGSWSIDPSVLEVGPWDLVADGAVRKRGVLVTDGRLPAHVDAVEVGEELRIEGSFASSGNRVFALHGPDRALEPLTLLAESADRLVVTSPAADGTVDLLVVSKGVEVGIADITGEPVIDTLRAVAEDTGDRPVPVEGEPRHGCVAAPGPAPLFAIAIGALICRRRP